MVADSLHGGRGEILFGTLAARIVGSQCCDELFQNDGTPKPFRRETYRDEERPPTGSVVGGLVQSLGLYLLALAVLFRAFALGVFVASLALGIWWEIRGRERSAIGVILGTFAWPMLGLVAPQ
ncbi:hypothetical protein ACQP00_23840 [Dactylosporangium sp. CS-047395]|uniref:hypothetical protein n=1 Tax=Dactylosporangium sp. CS-047395 TaxID=3239936 RepID=UPI003D8A1081